LNLNWLLEFMGPPPPIKEFAGRSWSGRASLTVM
jgi:hypothetical protein